MDPKLESLLNDERALKRAYHSNVVKALGVRIASMRNASDLQELHHLPGRAHQLKGDRAGQFAMELPDGLRLVFCPTEPAPHRDDGGVDLAAVTRITLIEITDYH